MAPKYRHGDWLLVRFSRPRSRGSGLIHGSARKWRVGAIVVIERRAQPGALFIKRLIKINTEPIASDLLISPEQTFWVEGDNRAISQDSRSWGALVSEEIVGRVLFRLRKNKNALAE